MSGEARRGRDGRVWATGSLDQDYYADNSGAHVTYRGESIHEPIRDEAWRWEHLWHDQGRFRI